MTTLSVRLRASCLIVPGLLAVACPAVSPAAAQQQTSPAQSGAFQLEAVTVTATRSENNSFDVPASVSVITREQLDDAQAPNLSVLRKVPGVDLGGGARPAGQIPTIRGLQGPRVILSVDGARRNYADNIRTPLLIDPDMVQQIDIVRGSESALYGSGGIGGVMALRTLEAEDILAPGRTVGGRAKIGFRSADHSVSTNLTGAARGGGLDILGSATLRDAGRIQTGDGNGLTNDQQLKSGLFKVGATLNEGNRVQLSYQKFADALVTPSNPGGSDAFGLLQRLKRRQDQFTGSYAFHDDGRKWIDGSATAYYTKLRFATTPYTAGVTATDIEMATAGVALQNSTRIEMAPWLRHRITYGIDAHRDRARNRDGGVANAVQPDGEQISQGLFLQDEVTIAEDWTLTGAIRHDRYRLEPVGQASSDNQRLSPKIALKWQVRPFLGLFVGYSEAFRAPTLGETYQNLSTTRALFNFRPNPGLKPETSRTKEAGFTLAFDDVLTGGDAMRLKTTIFTETVENMITSATIGRYTRAAPFSGTGLIFQNQNVAKAERHGGELMASYSAGGLDLGIGYSHLRAKDASTGAGLFAPPDKVTVGTRYRFENGWAVWWTGQFVDEQHRDATALRQRDGYGLHDIGVTYNRNWYRVDLGVTNLFDKAYATYQQSQTTTYTYEEGRSVNLTLSARF
ncbi:TonB-dependent hemoglobin/transferrin/lactoferrin family receptor [Azospirillum humicireducens]|uniref:TonB-dependent hemoglobin/transferrin/lactoferrin family receptor n=1 Tax=Azospirillum humicireducens TaxID=1226968 RepID=UPI001F02BE74|nr:TonB-dependent hemoglobin/transferrin/lactoferrin family receptor [Azospirillum humicireducens]